MYSKSEGEPKSIATKLDQPGEVDLLLIKRCIKAATRIFSHGMQNDLLELLSFDILNSHLKLNVDLSGIWQSLLTQGNISMFALGCGFACGFNQFLPDKFKIESCPGRQNLKMLAEAAMAGFKRDLQKTNRDDLISILEIMRDKSDKDIVVFIERGLTIARSGPDPGFRGNRYLDSGSGDHPDIAKVEESQKEQAPSAGCPIPRKNDHNLSPERPAMVSPINRALTPPKIQDIALFEPEGGKEYDSDDSCLDYHDNSSNDHDDYSGRSSPRDYAACSLEECGYCGHCPY
jgi:hypothetical protein